MDLRLEISPPELDLHAIPMCSRGCGVRAIAVGLCKTCHEYQRRTGKPRPDDLIVEHGQRIMERRLLAQGLSL